MSEIKFERATASHTEQLRRWHFETLDRHREWAPRIFREIDDSQAFVHNIQPALKNSAVSLEKSSAEVWLAVVEGKAVGYVSIKFSNLGFTDCLVDDIYVEANHRGNHIATQLLELAVTRALQRGSVSIQATVWGENSASKKLFDSTGFKLERSAFAMQLVKDTELPSGSTSFLALQWKQFGVIIFVVLVIILLVNAFG